MSSLRITSPVAWLIIFLILLGLLLANCNGLSAVISEPTPTIGEPKVTDPPTPVPPGVEVSVRIDVTSSKSVSYQWKTSEGGGEIIRGGKDSAAIWLAPQQPGTYNVQIEVVIDNVKTEKSVAVKVEAPPTPIHTSTLTPTNTLTPIPTSPPPTDTPTPTSPPPPDTPTPMPTSLPTNTPITTAALPSPLCTEQKLRPGGDIFCTFTSGVRKDTGRQEILIGRLEAGRYVLVLQNASPQYSGHWLIWDYLALQSGGDLIWAIGNSDAPPNYTQKAFAEFCDSNQRADCATEFMVGTTSVGDFVKELNDGSFPIEIFHFEITDQQANSDLTLVLSTLFSSHDNIENFQMQVSLADE